MLKIQFFLYSYYVGLFKNPLLTDQKVTSTKDNYIWSACQYPEATIYRYGLQGETCPESWNFYCEFFDEKNFEFEWEQFADKSSSGVCIGLYCDYGELLSDNYSCIESNYEFYLPTYENATFVYFNSSLSDISEATESEKYLMNMKSGLLKLNTNKIFDIELMESYMGSISSTLFYQAKTFSEFTMPFFTLKENGSNFVVVDYQCSTLDIDNYLAEFYRYLDVLNIEGFYTFSSYIVLILVILVARNFRQTINGKCVLVHSIIQSLFYAQYFIPDEFLASNGIITCVTYQLECFAFMWLAIISYDYFKTIKSNVSVQLSNINQKKQMLKYSIIGFIAPFIIATSLMIYMYFYLSQKSIVYSIGLFFLLLLKTSTGVFFVIFLIIWRVKHVERADIEKMNQCGSTETKFERYLKYARVTYLFCIMVLSIVMEINLDLYSLATARLIDPILNFLCNIGCLWVIKGALFSIIFKESSGILMLLYVLFSNAVWKHVVDGYVRISQIRSSSQNYRRMTD